MHKHDEDYWDPYSRSGTKVLEQEKTEVGFQPRITQDHIQIEIDIIEIPKPQLKSKDEVTKVILTESCIVMKTKNNKMHYCQQPATRNSVLKPLKLPLIGQGGDKDRGIIEGVGGSIKNLVNKSKDTFEKNILLKDKTTKYKIDSFFYDCKGNHFIFHDKSQKESFYWSPQLDKIEYSRTLKGKKIEAVSWDPDSDPLHSNETIFGVDHSVYSGLIKVQQSQKQGALLSLGKNAVEAFTESHRHELLLENIFDLHQDDRILVIEHFYFQKSKESEKFKCMIVVAFYKIYVLTYNGNVSNLSNICKENRSIYLEENSRSQKGGTNCMISVYLDVYTHKPSSFIIKKRDEVFYYKIVFPKGTPTFKNVGNLIHQSMKQLPVKSQLPEFSSTKLTALNVHIMEYTYIVVYDFAIIARSLIPPYAELCYISHSQRVQNFPVDPIINSHWGFSANKMIFSTLYENFEVSIENEYSEIEGYFLDIGDHKGSYKAAKKHKLPYFTKAATNYAYELFNKKADYKNAARIFLKTNLSYEEIILNFLTGCPDPNAKLDLLQAILKKTKNSNTSNNLINHMVHSLMMEILVNDINHNEMKLKLDKNIEEIETRRQSKIPDQTKKKKNENDTKLNESIDKLENELFEQVLNNATENEIELRKQGLLNPNEDVNNILTHDILMNHGRYNEFLNFSELAENYENHVVHYINEEIYDKAITKIRLIQQRGTMEKLVYNYANILMRYRPDMLTQLLFDYLKTFDPLKLVTAIANITDPRYYSEAIEFLTDIIERLGCEEVIIFNLLVYFYCKSGNEKEFEKFLSKQLEYYTETGKTFIDLNFALRKMKEVKLLSSQVYILAMMGNYQEAVECAIEAKNYELAKAAAFLKKDLLNSANEQAEQKKLLMKIVEEMIKDKEVDVKSILNLVKQGPEVSEEDIVKIDDFLSLFPTNVDIGVFKKDLSDTLKYYNKVLENFKLELDSFSVGAEKILIDLLKIRSKYQVLYSDDECEQCSKNILTSEFIAFPCGHCFHRDCFIGLKQTRLGFNFPPESTITMNQIKKMNQQIHDGSLTIQQSNTIGKSNANSIQAAAEYYITGKMIGFDYIENTNLCLQTEEIRELEQLKENLCRSLLFECPLCGNEMIELVYKKYDYNNSEQLERDRLAWL